MLQFVSTASALLVQNKFPIYTTSSLEGLAGSEKKTAGQPFRCFSGLASGASSFGHGFARELEKIAVEIG